jgi:NitT/TauT family transport system ATP-binding protein
MTERVVAAFVPLVDCAVLVAAREHGFAAAAGVELELVKEPSWASLRDHLCLGHVDCAHALAPLPVALTLGVGHLQVDCLAPFVLSRGGNAVTVSARLLAEMQAAEPGLDFAAPARVGRALAAVARNRAAPVTLAMVFPFSNHNYDLRYWLASAGVHPDRDVRLVAIPPPLMVDSLRAGLVDGFCVGEPWNSLAAARGVGSIVATQAQLFPRAVEKVLAVRTAFAQRSGETLARLLDALAAAAAWADEPANRPALAATLAAPAYLDVPQEIVALALDGDLRLAGGATPRERDFLYFHRHGANAPREADGLWVYAHMVRWGQVAPSPQAERAAARMFAPDWYRRSVRAAAVDDAAPPAPFDGIEFSAGDVSAYLRGFELKTPFSLARSI